ncbi:flagellar radial spoke protein 5 isoform X2 [Populus alba x Populus x berolinensis]|nr:flagellar radial spoke protein 5 isoform X2 [Populus alba x Populus x berolinensis]
MPLKHVNDLKEEGKIKTVALTNFDTERLQIILENGIPVVSNQVQTFTCGHASSTKNGRALYGTVMGGLLSEKFLDTNLSIPFSAPPLNTPSLQKWLNAWGGWSLFQSLLRTLKKIASKHGVSIPTVAVKIHDSVRLGLAEHINDANAVFSLVLDEEDMNSIQEVSKKGKDLLRVIGDCGDEYRRI